MATVLGPENDILWLSKPARVNSHLFIIPSTKNKAFQHFLQKHTFKEVSEFIKDGASENGGIFGRIISHTTPPASPSLTDRGKGRPSLSLSLQDVQTSDTVDIIFKGDSAIRFPSVKYALLYVHGGKRVVGADGDISLVCSDSSSDLLCYLINRWAYKRQSAPSPSPSPRRRPRSPDKRPTSPDLLPLHSSPPPTSTPSTSTAPPPKAAKIVSPVLKASRRQKPDTFKTATTSNNANPSLPVSATVDYEYTKLNELGQLPNGSRVNLAGVVSFFKPSQRSKGTDYFVSFTLSDSTLNAASPINVVAFRKDESELPNLRKVGDVVLLRRVEVGSYNNLPQIKSKNYSSFHIFDGYSSTDVPYSSSRNASLSDSDKKIVKSLRQWKDSLSEFQFCQLKDIKLESLSNIKCYVVSVNKLIPDKLLSLSVWDGTIPFSSSPSSPDVDESLCTVLLFLKPNLPLSTSDITPGICLSLREVFARRVFHALDTAGNSSSSVHLLFNYFDHDKLSVLQKDDPDTISLTQSFTSTGITSLPVIEERLYPHLSATTLHLSHKPTPLADILTVSSPEPYNHRCLVQVVGIDAHHINDTIILVCPSCRSQFSLTNGTNGIGSQCPSCIEDTPPVISLLTIEYEFVLSVRDQTGELLVLVRSEEGEKLMQVKPSNFHMDKLGAGLAHERLKLLFGCDPFQVYMEGDPGLMDCSINSVPSQDGFSIVHCLFDTYIISESNESSDLP